MHFPIVNKR